MEPFYSFFINGLLNNILYGVMAEKTDFEALGELARREIG
jgi:hypothetical protein